MDCILCSNKDIDNIENIDIKSLTKIYFNATNIDFSYLFGENTKLMYNQCRRCGLKYFTPLIVGDEKFYNSFQEIDWYYMEEKEEFQYAKKFINKNDKVLEVGCGKGAFARIVPTNCYVGLDPSEKAKKMASKNGVRIKNESIELHAQNHQDYYDVVCSFQVLEHVPNPFSFLNSSIQTLKKGGFLIIAVPSEDSFVKYITNGILNMPPHHISRWSDDALNYLTKIFDLELLEIYHEKVQKTHKRYFLYTLISNIFLKPKLVDLSIRRKILSKIQSLLAMLIEKNFKKEFLPNGHTVVGVYRRF